MEFMQFPLFSLGYREVHGVAPDPSPTKFCLENPGVITGRQRGGLHNVVGPGEWDRAASEINGLERPQHRLYPRRDAGDQDLVLLSLGR